MELMSVFLILQRMLQRVLKKSLIMQRELIKIYSGPHFQKKGVLSFLDTVSEVAKSSEIIIEAVPERLLQSNLFIKKLS